MALQSPFFGKRENEPLTPRTSAPQTSPSSSSFAPSSSNSQPAMRTAAEPSASVTSSAAASLATDKTPVQEPGSKLIVGPNIKLKGVEITDCDTLVVEGTVEATMDSRVMQIAEQGAFNGSAEIDIAEIHGTFDGDLVVRDKLVIFSTGKVTGKIRYGKIVIEEGGQLSGEIVFGTGLTSKPSSKPALSAA